MLGNFLLACEDTTKQKNTSAHWSSSVDLSDTVKEAMIIHKQNLKPFGCGSKKRYLNNLIARFTKTACFKGMEYFLSQRHLRRKKHKEFKTACPHKPSHSPTAHSAKSLRGFDDTFAIAVHVGTWRGRK